MHPATHRICNHNLEFKYKIPVILDNSRVYDSLFIMQEAINVKKCKWDTNSLKNIWLSR